jgi:hypothetical protein
MAESPFIAVGATITLAGYIYTAAEVTPYTRRDGKPSQVITWRGECAACGQPFEQKASRRPTNLVVTCPEHRGQRVKVATLTRAIHAALRALEAGKAAEARELLVAAIEAREPAAEEHHS